MDGLDGFSKALRKDAFEFLFVFLLRGSSRESVNGFMKAVTWKVRAFVKG